MMKHEYHEGPFAAEHFEKAAIKVFRAPESGPNLVRRSIP